MEFEKAIKSGENNFEIPRSWLFIHYYEALNILFRFENSLRVFTYVILKNNLFEKWKEVNISSDGNGNTLNNIAKKRITQAKVFGYLGYNILVPVMHLTSGELIEIITSDSYWKYFKQYFLGSREIMKNKLLEIGAIRNSLAHFRPIKEDDVEVIKQNVKQTMMGIEECLAQLTKEYSYVPTNCEEDWYKTLSVIGNEYLSINFQQSTNESWVRFIINVDLPLVKKNIWGEKSFNYQVANLRTPELLNKYNKLAKYTLFLNEVVRQPIINDQNDPELKKNITIMFGREVLQKNYEVIANEIKEILRTISDENELLKKDHLAKGKIVEPISVSSYLKKIGTESRWEIDKEKLRCEMKADHPVEYWGKSFFTFDDFFTEVKSYPWMASDISLDSLPF